MWSPRQNVRSRTESVPAGDLTRLRAMQSISKPAWPRIEHTTLTKPSWQCAACATPIMKGHRIRITISPTGCPNRVEHEPTCPALAEPSSVRPH